MNFVSLEFLAFFLLVYTLYWSIPHHWKRFLLIAASTFFYYTLSPNFTIHIWLMVGLNFFFVNRVGKSKRVFHLAIVLNVLNLAFFKYFYLFMQAVGNLAGIESMQTQSSLNQLLGNSLGLTGLEIVLPATISYYTFQTISLMVDSRRGEISGPVGFWEVASYILFFPVMVAGPILRFHQIRDQFGSPSMKSEDMVDGIWLVIRGIIKKSLMTSTFSASIYPVFADPQKYSGEALLWTAFFFAFNLYLDFSGLTDLARGMGKLLGMNLPENFRAPFFLNGFGDFWRRWHLTFSHWIRDYIYIPLGGSRVSLSRVSLNYIITFALGGLWHGANWNFLFWGVLTGIYLSIEKILKDNQIRIIPDWGIPTYVLRYVLVLSIYVFSWILFFTPNLTNAITVMQNILSFQNGLPLTHLSACLFCVFFSYLFHIQEEWPEKFRVPFFWKAIPLPIVSVLIMALVLFFDSGNGDFFYSQF